MQSRHLRAMKRDEKRNDGIRHAFFMCAILSIWGTRLRHFIKVVVFINVRNCEERFWHFIRTHVAIDYSCMVM